MYNIGEALKEQREKKNMSMKELAKQIGTSHQNISRWEREEAVPSIEKCILLADFYDVSLDELVGRKI